MKIFESIVILKIYVKVASFICTSGRIGSTKHTLTISFNSSRNLSRKLRLQLMSILFNNNFESFKQKCEKRMRYCLKDTPIHKLVVDHIKIEE